MDDTQNPNPAQPTTPPVTTPNEPVNPDVPQNPTTIPQEPAITETPQTPTETPQAPTDKPPAV